MTADLTARITEILAEMYGTRWLTTNAVTADLIAQAAEEHYRPRVETVAEAMRQEWGVGYRTFDGIENVIPREGRTDAEILNMEHRYSDHQGYSVVSRHVTEWVVWSPGAGE